MIFDDLFGILARVYLEIIKLSSKRHQDLPGPAGSAEILFGFYSDFIGILFDFS